MIFKRRNKTFKRDSFLKRINSTVIGEGMLKEGNIYLMDFAIQNMPDEGIVLEIGSYAGLSTNVILHLLENHNKNNTFVGCDAWIYEGFNDYKIKSNKFIDGSNKISRIEYCNYIKRAFINSINLLHPNRKPYTCHLTSDAFFNIWKTDNKFTDVFNREFKINEEISFCYIDGNHSYEQTKNDFENVGSKLKTNGFILIDDSAKFMNFGSSKFINNIKKDKNYKIVDSNPNFLIQKIS